MKKILKGALTALLLAGFVFTGCTPEITPETENKNSQTQNKENESENKTDSEEEPEEKDDPTPETPEVKGTAVTNFKAVAGNSKVTLSWTNPATGTLKDVKLYKGTTSTASDLITTITNKSTTYEVTGLTNGTKYYFKAVSSFTDDTSEYTCTSISATPFEPNTSDPYANLTSVQMAAEMTIGWNLGNTLDAPTENGWGMPTTTKAMIDAVAAAGFKTIRIPVSWSKHVSGSNYTIDSAWMSRVKEIVDWAIADNMVVILNVHHDNYYAGISFINSSNETEKGLGDSSISGFAITTNSILQTKSKNYLRSVWSQIATEFATYDNSLVFEVLNEPRCIGETQEWWIGTVEEAKIYCDVITAYEELCIETIRGISGNANRFIMVPGYAASGENQTMLKAYTMPSDSATDKLLLSTHAYSPSDFALGGNNTTYEDNDEGTKINSIFNFLKTRYLDCNIGVVMGEASCSNKDNLSEREKWFNAYFAKAKTMGIPVVLWDNMVFTPNGTNENGENHGYLNRNACSWYFPTLIKKAMDATGVTGYSIPEYIVPTAENIGWNESSAIEIFTESVNTGWSAKKLDKTLFANAKEGSIIKFECTSTNGGCIRMINDSWTIVYNQGTVVNGHFAGDDISVKSGSQSIYYVLTASDANNWKTYGLNFVGPDLTITSIKFQN